MLSRRIVCLIIVSLLVMELEAQPFMQSAGITFTRGRASSIQIPINAGPYTATIYSALLTYYPRVNVMESDNTSLSIGVPFGLGLGKTRSSAGGPDGGFHFGADLPVVVDFNMGYKSSSENESKSGGYLGLGFGYSFSGWDDGSKRKTLTDGGDHSANSYGPIFRGGVRMHSGMKKHADWGYSVGLSYKLGFEKAKYKTLAVSFLCDL